MARLNTSNIDPEIQIGLGILLNMTGEFEKAVDCFELALTQKSNDYLLWNKLGYFELCILFKITSATFANSNESSKAIGAYYNALEINPEYIRARCNLAIACIQMCQYPEAAEHLYNALKIQSSHTLKHVKDGVQSTTVWNTLKMVVDGYSIFLNLIYSVSNFIY